MPPSFDSVKYWDTRFSKDSKPFDWLLNSTQLSPHIKLLLKDHKTYTKNELHKNRKPQILHIGCGTSDISTEVLSLSADDDDDETMMVEPEQICNVDYSSVAIELGRKRQVESRRRRSGEEDDFQALLSRWETLDLLSTEEVLKWAEENESRSVESGKYDIILDKSTSDAISCGPDVTLALPLLPPSSGSPDKGVKVHPLYALALHLAILAAPGCHWLVCSYSPSRFPFWDSKTEAQITNEICKRLKTCIHVRLPEDIIHRIVVNSSRIKDVKSLQEVLNPWEWDMLDEEGPSLIQHLRTIKREVEQRILGCSQTRHVHSSEDALVHIQDLWRMVKYEEVVKTQERPEDGIHRPPETCYLYTLVRTGVDPPY